MTQHKLIAIDLAKNVFQVCLMNKNNTVVVNKQLRRSELMAYIQKQEPTTVAMEACYSSHYWARSFQEMGHEVKLIPAQFVKPFVRGNKSDRNDAVAIAEAAQRPNLKAVPIKSLHQQDIQCLHRIRERCVRNRTGLVNQTRGLLSEFGVIAPQGLSSFNQLLCELMEPKENRLTPIFKNQLGRIADEYYAITDRLDEINKELKTLAETIPACRLLMTIPWIGCINATGLYSAIGNGSQFNNGRELAVWLGLNPRQFGSGEKQTSGGITKRGNRYLRKQLVHGARAIASRYKNREDRVAQWCNALMERRGKHKAYVGLANKLARIVWAVLNKNEPYKLTMPAA